MSDDAHAKHEQRLEAWRNAFARASENFARGIEARAHLAYTDFGQDAERTAEIDALEALWLLEGPSGD